MAVFGFREFGFKSQSPPADYTVINSVLITLGAIIGIVLLANIYTWMRAIVRLAVPTRKQACFFISVAELKLCLFNSAPCHKRKTSKETEKT